MLFAPTMHAAQPIVSESPPLAAAQMRLLAPTMHAQLPLTMRNLSAARHSAVRMLATPPELRRKQNTIATVVGTIYFSQLLLPLYTAAARLGLVDPPPINTLTAIANAAMDEAVANGTVQPLLATAWAQRLWIDLLVQYNAAPETFLPSYCTDAAHTAWCSAAGL